ncbi:DedA family protein [Pseudochelatococcus sp. G4_1912]|jgi:membrane protein DedA with SNARE-associated domain|uniref:DedA family protein n=1 Tax=Pseudochelatococcus sp. G4_1912 TaxID=3114288 RepID=UPI0039C61E4C
MSLSSLIDTTIAFASTHAAWASPIVFLVAFAESFAFLSLLVPGWAILIGIGALIGASEIAFWPVWAAAAAGAALGDWISYWAGYYFKDRALTVWPLSRHPEMAKRGQAFFERFGVWSIAIGRFFGPLRAVVPLIAGIFGMPQLYFQLANVGSAMVWAFILLAPTAAVLRHFMG